MPIETWWPLLQPDTRRWLIDNNGDVVPAPILDEITRVAGPVTADTWWVGENGPSGFQLSDAAVDWIEEVWGR